MNPSDLNDVKNDKDNALKKNFDSCIFLDESFGLDDSCSSMPELITHFSDGSKQSSPGPSSITTDISLPELGILVNDKLF